MGDPKFKEEDDSRVLQVLEALKQASHDLQAHPAAESGDDTNSSSSSAAVKALLELETESDSILSKDPQLSNLSHHLADLKALVDTLRKSRGHSLRSFLARRASTSSISRVAESIGSEIQAWIDRETIEKLIRALKEPIVDEDDLIKLLTQLELRLNQGFDGELQDLVLRSELIRSLDRVLCNSKLSIRTREHAAYAIAALIRFNKDVFVGEVMMRATVQIQALIAMASPNSLKVLCSLVKSIKSPLVDEIESNGEIPKIISFLSNGDLELQLVAMDCVLEIGYFGRKEAIEAVLNSGLIKRLVELQRSELGGDIIDAAGRVIRERKFWESHPFASCVARFAVQLEVGEGLRRRERRALKQEILERVKEASVSDAEAATIAAEVLWGSYP